MEFLNRFCREVLCRAAANRINDAAAIKDALVRQLYSPVRWVETVQAIAAQGVGHAAECGPGKVLAGLNKRIVAEMTCAALTSNDAVAEAKNQLNA